MDPFCVSFGLFFGLIGFAFWLKLDLHNSPSEIARPGLPIFENPPPMPECKKRCDCWCSGLSDEQIALLKKGFEQRAGRITRKK